MRTLDLIWSDWEKLTVIPTEVIVMTMMEAEIDNKIIVFLLLCG